MVYSPGKLHGFLNANIGNLESSLFVNHRQAIPQGL